MGYISGWPQETITGTDSIGIFIFPDEQQNRTCPIQITFACRGFGAGGALRLPVKEIVADRVIHIGILLFCFIPKLSFFLIYQAPYNAFAKTFSLFSISFKDTPSAVFH